MKQRVNTATRRELKFHMKTKFPKIIISILSLFKELIIGIRRNQLCWVFLFMQMYKKIFSFAVLCHKSYKRDNECCINIFTHFYLPSQELFSLHLICDQISNVPCMVLKSFCSKADARQILYPSELQLRANRNYSCYFRHRDQVQQKMKIFLSF